MAKKKVKRSNDVYLIYATRETSEFDQYRQVMRCKILEAHNGYFLVESLKRYNKKYENASVSAEGIPIRRVNKEQALVVIDEKSGKWIAWDTVLRREGVYKPGRVRGGK